MSINLYMVSVMDCNTCSNDASRVQGWRDYANGLRSTGMAYVNASHAPGMDRNASRREAALYLREEGHRLMHEANAWQAMAIEHGDHANMATLANMASVRLVQGA